MNYTRCRCKLTNKVMVTLFFVYKKSKRKIILKTSYMHTGWNVGGTTVDFHTKQDMLYNDEKSLGFPPEHIFQCFLSGTSWRTTSVFLFWGLLSVNYEGSWSTLLVAGNSHCVVDPLVAFGCLVGMLSLWNTSFPFSILFDTIQINYIRFFMASDRYMAMLRF